MASWGLSVLRVGAVLGTLGVVLVPFLTPPVKPFKQSIQRCKGQWHAYRQARESGVKETAREARKKYYSCFYHAIHDFND